MSKAITNKFFGRPTLEVAPELIGKVIQFGRSSGRIVEVEAYTDDPASHGHRRTERSALMYETCGRIYVYFVYGMYHCLNFTTEKESVGAVLIRAVEPLAGISLMQKRRGVNELQLLCNGPGKLCQAFGIDLKLNGTRVGERLKLFDGPVGKVLSSPRIGISKATDLQWRFYEDRNLFVSKRLRKTQ